MSNKITPPTARQRERRDAALVGRRFAGLWRKPEFLKLWAGQTISLFGSQISLLALPLTAALVLRASPAEMGVLGAVGAAPFLLLGLIAGAWVDRVRRRRPMLIATDLGRAVVLGSIPVAALLGLLRLEHLYVAGFMVGALEGQGNSYVDFWQQGLQQNPPSRFAMLPPWAAQAEQKPITFLGTAFISMNAFKKSSPDRIKELLRIVNYLASPFGSQEALLLSYGIKDQDYTLDDKGTPRPTAEGVARAGYVPWRYLGQHPWVTYQAGLPGYAQASHEAEKATLPLGVDDPTNGLYAPTQYTKGASADVVFNDGVRDIMLGRRSMSEYDQLVQDWRAAAGDQVRKELTNAMAATS